MQRRRAGCLGRAARPRRSPPLAAARLCGASRVHNAASKSPEAWAPLPKEARPVSCSELRSAGQRCRGGTPLHSSALLCTCCGRLGHLLGLDDDRAARLGLLQLGDLHRLQEAHLRLVRHRDPVLQQVCVAAVVGDHVPDAQTHVAWNGRGQRRRRIERRVGGVPGRLRAGCGAALRGSSGPRSPAKVCCSRLRCMSRSREGRPRCTATGGAHSSWSRVHRAQGSSRSQRTLAVRQAAQARVGGGDQS